MTALRSSTCILTIVLLNFSIPDVPFPVLLPKLISSRLQAKPATLLILIVFSHFFGEGGCGTQYF